MPSYEVKEGDTLGNVLEALYTEVSGNPFSGGANAFYKGHEIVAQKVGRGIRFDVKRMPKVKQEDAPKATPKAK